MAIGMPSHEGAGAAFRTPMPLPPAHRATVHTHAPHTIPRTTRLVNQIPPFTYQLPRRRPCGQIDWSSRASARAVMNPAPRSTWNWLSSTRNEYSAAIREATLLVDGHSSSAHDDIGRSAIAVLTD